MRSNFWVELFNGDLIRWLGNESQIESSERVSQ
jgi:hypothetical protein